MSPVHASKHRDQKQELDVKESPEVAQLPSPGLTESPSPGLTQLPSPRLTEPSTAKRQKLEHHQRGGNYPPAFWDNLSQLWLIPSCLQEFDRRTVWPSTPTIPDLTGTEFDLTRLVQFAKEGGPNLEDLRAYPGSEEASLDRESASNQTMKTSTAYSPAFQQHLIDHGCYPAWHPNPAMGINNQPQNFGAIQTRLAMPRAASSAKNQQDFIDFLTANNKAATEGTSMSAEIRQMDDIPNIHSLHNVLFNNLDPLIDPTTKIKLGQNAVDSYDGNTPTPLNPSIREGFLGNFIVPSTATDRTCLPNFFLEAKGKKGVPEVVMRQAWWAGCLGARGVHELRAWIDPNTFEDNNAYTIACTYEAGSCTLTVYTIHPRRSPNNNPRHRPISSMSGCRYEYIMSQLYSINMKNNLDGFKEGLKVFGNARVWAQQQRDLLYAAANARA
ncbi:MAG: hypothetical protein Q9221_000973 [Calogaya cf. arnoldii]